MNSLCIPIVSEDDGVARIPVTRGPGTYGDVLVRYATQDGSAISGMDYLPAQGILTLLSGHDTGFINVSILDDTQREFLETFEISLLEVNGEWLLCYVFTLFVESVFLFNMTTIDQYRFQALPFIAGIWKLWQL